MNGFLQNIFSRRKILSFFPRYVRTPLLSSLLIGFSTAFVLTALYYNLQPEVPFFYSLAESRDYLASKSWLWVFPIFSLTVAFIHPILIRGCERHHERIVPQLFAWITLAVQILIGVAFLRILLLIK